MVLLMLNQKKNPIKRINFFDCLIYHLFQIKKKKFIKFGIFFLLDIMEEVKKQYFSGKHPALKVLSENTERVQNFLLYAHKNGARFTPANTSSGQMIVTPQDYKTNNGVAIRETAVFEHDLFSKEKISTPGFLTRSLLLKEWVIYDIDNNTGEFKIGKIKGLNGNSPKLELILFVDEKNRKLRNMELNALERKRKGIGNKTFLESEEGILIPGNRGNIEYDFEENLQDRGRPFLKDGEWYAQLDGSVRKISEQAAKTLV